MNTLSTKNVLKNRIEVVQDYQGEELIFNSK